LWEKKEIIGKGKFLGIVGDEINVRYEKGEKLLQR